jgi:hypothetical protein
LQGMSQAARQEPFLLISLSLHKQCLPYLSACLITEGGIWRLHI